MKKPNNAKHPTPKVSKYADVAYTGNAVFNHKVEQVLRAILLPLEDSVHNTVHLCATKTLQVNCNNDSLLNSINGEPVYYKVGFSTLKGWSFSPLQNSLLSLLGIKPSVALFVLSQQCLRDESEPNSSEVVPALVEKGDSLLMFAPALVAAARSLVLHYGACVNEVNNFVKTYGNYPRYFSYSVKG